MPGLKKADISRELEEAGIDKVLIVCVNDGAVMTAWKKDQGLAGSDLIEFVADTQANERPPRPVRQPAARSRGMRWEAGSSSSSATAKAWREVLRTNFCGSDLQHLVPKQRTRS